MTTTTSPIFANARIAAFGCGPTRRAIMIEGNVVRVWDPVAKHYTACHGMSDRTVRRILRTVR